MSLASIPLHFELNYCIAVVINATNDYLLDGADGLKEFLLKSDSSPFKDNAEAIWTVCWLQLF